MEETNDYSGSKTGNSKSIKAGGLNLLRMLNLFAANTEKASEMAANMNVGAEAINSTVDSMAMGAKYLDGIWKGDTKETFMEELAELHSLIKENSDTLKELGAKIEEENRITIAQQKESYNNATNLYFENK